MLQAAVQLSNHKQFYTVKTFSLSFPQMKRKGKECTQEGTLTQDQGLPSAGPLTEGNMVAAEDGSLLQMFSCLLHSTSTPETSHTKLEQLSQMYILDTSRPKYSPCLFSLTLLHFLFWW